MSHTPALNELNDAIANRQLMIKQALVARAVHEVLEYGLDAAQEVEERLERSGYEQTRRGDWMLFE